MNQPELADYARRFRPSALKTMQQLYNRSRDPQLRKGLKLLTGFLDPRATTSFILPVNGHYIDPQTPETHIGGDLCLPFPEVILEYPMSKTASESRLPSENLKPSVALICVAKVSGLETVVVPMFRAGAGADARWLPPQLALILHNDARFFVHERGIGCGGVSVQPLLEDAPLELPVPHLIQQYADELKVLVHFSKICQSKNISLLKHKWSASLGPNNQRLLPEHYYTLTCTGPTSWNWLPTSGMVTQ